MGEKEGRGRGAWSTDCPDPEMIRLVLSGDYTRRARRLRSCRSAKGDHVHGQQVLTVVYADKQRFCLYKAQCTLEGRILVCCTGQLNSMGRHEAFTAFAEDSESMELARGSLRRRDSGQIPGHRRQCHGSTQCTVQRHHGLPEV